MKINKSNLDLNSKNYEIYNNFQQLSEKFKIQREFIGELNFFFSEKPTLNLIIQISLFEDLIIKKSNYKFYYLNDENKEIEFYPYYHCFFIGEKSNFNVIESSNIFIEKNTRFKKTMAITEDEFSTISKEIIEKFLNKINIIGEIEIYFHKDLSYMKVNNVQSKLKESLKDHQLLISEYFLNEK